MPASLTQPLERGFGGCQWFLLRGWNRSSGSIVNSKCRMTWEVIRVLSILTGIYLLLGQLL